MDKTLEVRKGGRPRTPLYKKRKIRFSYLEAAFERVLDRLDDPVSIMIVERELKMLVAYEKSLESEKLKKVGGEGGF